MTYTRDTSRTSGGENFACSDTDGWVWHQCGWTNNLNSAAQHATVPHDARQPVYLLNYKRGAESRHPPGVYPLWNTRTYSVAVRSVVPNGEPSAWTTADLVRPIYGRLREFSYTRGTGSVTLNWKQNYWTTDYSFECDHFDPTQSPYDPTFTVCGTLSNLPDTQSPRSITISRLEGGRHGLFDRRHEDPRHRRVQQQHVGHRTGSAAAHPSARPHRHDYLGHDGDAGPQGPHDAVVVLNQPGAAHDMPGPGRGARAPG